MNNKESVRDINIWHNKGSLCLHNISCTYIRLSSQSLSMYHHTIQIFYEELLGGVGSTL